MLIFVGTDNCIDGAMHTVWVNAIFKSYIILRLLHLGGLTSQGVSSYGSRYFVKLIVLSRLFFNRHLWTIPWFFSAVNCNFPVVLAQPNLKVEPMLQVLICFDLVSLLRLGFVILTALTLWYSH